MICTIIDHLTSMVHLVPVKQEYKAKQIAELVFDVVYKSHGLPEMIVSDRDSLFTSTFWARLHKLIGTQLRISSSWHPQTDGATERANRTLGQMLRQAIGPTQRNWVNKLPAIEFAMNSARSETTGFSPFFLNYGRTPRPLLWDYPKQDEYPGVRDMALKIKEAIMSAHDAIITARVKQTRLANNRRRAAPFVLGDLVYLSTQNISLPKGRARKLAPKYIGPYRITRELEPGASFALDLPNELKRRGLHNAFHASLLKAHVPSDDRRFPGRQLSQFSGIETDPREWEVDRILSHSGKGKSAQFELKWKTGDVTWEPFYVIKHLQALDEYCEAMGIEKPSHLPAGKGDLPEEEHEQVIRTARVHLTSEEKNYKDEGDEQGISVRQSTENLPAYTMPFDIALSSDYFTGCAEYAAALRRHLIGATESPGAMPEGYVLYASLVHNRDVAPIPRDWDGPAPNMQLGPYNGTDPSAHPCEYHRIFVSDLETGTNWVVPTAVMPSTWVTQQGARGYGQGGVGLLHPSPVSGVGEASALLSAIALGNALKDAMSTTRSGRIYKGMYGQRRVRSSESEYTFSEETELTGNVYLEERNPKSFFKEPELAHLPPPLGKRLRKSRKGRKNRKAKAAQTNLQSAPETTPDVDGDITMSNSGKVPEVDTESDLIFGSDVEKDFKELEEYAQVHGTAEAMDEPLF
jgi:hypothetical protein